MNRGHGRKRKSRSDGHVNAALSPADLKHKYLDLADSALKKLDELEELDKKADKICKLDKKADELDKRTVSEEDLQRWQAEYINRREGRSETQNHVGEGRRPAKGRKQNVKKEEAGARISPSFRFHHCPDRGFHSEFTNLNLIF